MPRYSYEFHPVHERLLDPRNHNCHNCLGRTPLHSPHRNHHLRLSPDLFKPPSLPNPATTRPPMNREVNDLVLVFSSAIVGAVIAFLAALVTFTFYHEIRELLLFRGLLIPNNEPRPTNPAADWARQELVRVRQEEARQLHAFLLLPPTENLPGLPVVRLPPDHQNDTNGAPTD